VPTLHLQLGGEVVSPDGKRVALTGSQALQGRGPVVEVSIGIESSAGSGLLQKGQQLPTPKTGFALIDTGASNTCIDEKTAEEMGLPVIDVAKMSSASHAGIDQNVYPIQITIAGSILQFNVPRAMGGALGAQGLIALIGRDVLQFCTLFYNGITGQITLSI
jgi:predicted aspartyl protease